MCSGSPASAPAAPSAYLTTEEVIRSTLLSEVPELCEVVLEQQVSDELLAQARRLLYHA